MKSIGVILLAMALLISTQPCAAQDPIPFNELARSSSAPPSLADMRAGNGGQTDASTHIYGRRHWSKTGKVLTFIGIPLMATGGATMGATLHGGCNRNDGTCVGGAIVDVFALMGEMLLTGSGVALTVVGATRRSTD